MQNHALQKTSLAKIKIEGKFVPVLHISLSQKDARGNRSAAPRILTSVLDETKWSASRSGFFTSGTHWTGR